MAEEIKKKRVMTRVGDIFCVEFQDRKLYLQFIALDMSELNSTTIRVFKKEYPLDYVFCAEEVVKGDVAFYVHTSLQPGLKQGLWTKVGKSNDVGDLSGILFRRTSDFSPQRLKSYRWWVGGINQEYTMIGELTEEYERITNYGGVWPPSLVVETIKLRRYPYSRPY